MSVSQNWVSGVSVEREKKKKQRKEGRTKGSRKMGSGGGLGWVVTAMMTERERRKGRWRNCKAMAACQVVSYVAGTACFLSPLLASFV
jgi:hypothetical protein